MEQATATTTAPIIPTTQMYVLLFSLLYPFCFSISFFIIFGVLLVVCIGASNSNNNSTNNPNNQMYVFMFIFFISISFFFIIFGLRATINHTPNVCSPLILSLFTLLCPFCFFSFFHRFWCPLSPAMEQTTAISKSIFPIYLVVLDLFPHPPYNLFDK